ncbi:hypothetical protein, partial [Aquimarina sp. RZ0]|uniref:hypothetical protein n=1 Tax=Aquimarina sp. RZ0 TaxID=2607730 RepID=UPI0011F3C7E9
MKHLKLVVTGLIASTLLVSCQKDDIETIAIEQSTLSTVPAGISQKLINLGVNPTNAERYEQKTSDGKVTQGWLS